MFSQFFKGIWKDRFIMFSLVNRDLQIKYRKSILGVAWSIITPLGLVLMIGSIYSIIFSTDPRTFIPNLFAGLNPWLFISGAADGGCLCYIAVEGYIKQIHANNQIFPLRSVISGFINMMYSILAFFIVYMFLQPEKFSPIMALVFPGLIIIFIFSWALAGITSIIHLYIRDFQPLLSLVLQGLFYVTPIIYTVDMLDANGASLVYKLNPFYYMIEVIKQPMLGNIPAVETYLGAILITLALFIISIIVTMREKDNVALKL